MTEEITDAARKAVTDKVSKAKSKLVMHHPFFATIVCSLPMTEDNSIPTMATNGRWIKYNHHFVEKMSLDETLFVLCHEVGHCMFAHMHRRGQRHPLKWNMAGDYVINDLLVADNVGQMPQGGLLNPQLVQQGGGTTDGVYDLIDDNDLPDQGGYNGTAIDVCEDAGGSPAEQAAAEAETKVMIAQAAQAAKMCGKLSANLSRLVDAALKPQVNWQDVLRRFVSAKAKVDRTYARPKRRFVADDIFLPSLSGERMGEILIAVDCSGSIGPQELNEFAAEMFAIKQDVRPTKVHVLYFDSSVSHYDKFEQDEDLHVEGHGGGGTAFSPIFAKADELGIEPVCCVVLTDLYCGDFGPCPSYPTLWVTTGSESAPWGEVIPMKSGQR
jgi:predicted metal-dependent peptidase